ncbi:MAG: S41 family peptidase [Alloprevotella sp.]|nr:S41 family peptidase [Alloprevotella sp.]
MRLLFTFLSALLLSAAFSPTAKGQTADEDARLTAISQQMRVFGSIYRELEQSYVDTLDAKKNIQKAIRSMLADVDPYTEYFAPNETGQLRQLTSGKYAGIGSLISYDRKERRCIISQPYAGLPAAEAGLWPGDVLLAQDGIDYGHPAEGREQAYSDSVSSTLRGEPGTQTTLTVRRYGMTEPFNVTITRRAITLPAVAISKMLTDSVGYILLTTFSEQTFSETRAALLALQRQGARGLIIDLRGNGGGLISQAVEVASLFLPKGSLVVKLKGRGGEEQNDYLTQREPIDTALPLAILVDAASASAAELLAGTLQDYDRAVVLGQRTYGKGLVQSPRVLPEGGILKLTTAKYYIPSGRCVQAYSFKNGLPQHLPDSIAARFKTRGGRTVLDAGGITPDIILQPDSLPTMISYLDTSLELLNYCARYRQQHPTIAPADTFSLSDAEYADFVNFLRENKFTYAGSSKAALDLLRQAAKLEGYADVAAKELDALEEKLVHNYDHDFAYWRDEVKDLVEARICSFYYYERGETESALRHDREVHTAVALLSDGPRYATLLRPND